MEIKKLIIVGVFAFVIFCSFYGVWNITGALTSSQCGDGFCHMSEETKGTCPQDCKTVCGDGLCEGSESVDCPSDCESDVVNFSPDKTNTYFIPISATLILSSIVLIWWIEKKYK